MEASGLSMGHAFAPAPRKFFRIEPIDEQPPEVVFQYPLAGSISTGRFADIVVRFSDVTGVDPSSLSLTVGSAGPFTVEDAEMVFENETLIFDSGDSALGAYGELIIATMQVTDLIGNTTTFSWDFRLELEAQVDESVLVFGSPDAQRAGQRISGPAAALATRLATGPARMNEPPAWSIARVEVDRVVISYETTAPQGFAAGQLLCNLPPASADEVFYRRVLAVSDDGGASELTLMTEEAPLTDFVTQGSVEVNQDSVLYELDENGQFTQAHSPVRASSATFEWEFPQVGFNADGALNGTSVSVSASQPPFEADISLTFNDFYWTLTPKLRGTAELGFEVSGGFSQDFGFYYGVEYHRADEDLHFFTRPELHPLTIHEMTIIPPEIDGQLSASLVLHPRIEYLVESLAGVSLGVELALTSERSLENPDLEVWATGEILVEAAGSAFKALEEAFNLDFEFRPDSPLFSYKLAPVDDAPIVFIAQPPSQVTVQVGEPTSISVSVANGGSAGYQWYSSKDGDTSRED